MVAKPRESCDLFSFAPVDKHEPCNYHEVIPFLSICKGAFHLANIYGIDVSEHNGTLDWAKIKASGISFAIIRTGYGVRYKDPQFENNLRGALAQGIPVGVYHFSYALNAAGAENEADYVLSLLEPWKDQITLPVFFDFEYDTIRYAEEQGVTLGAQAFNDHAVAFLEKVKAAGYVPGIYYNLDYKNRFVDATRLGWYVQWYAQYNSTASWTGYDLWQYSSSHTISGVAGRFDINVADESFLTRFLPPEEEPTPALPDPVRYYRLSDVTSETYLRTLNALIEKGYLLGKGGEGQNRVIDLTEDSVRLLVMLDRAGVFGD